VAEDSVARPVVVRQKAGAYAGKTAYGAAANLPPTKAAGSAAGAPLTTRARKPGLDSMGPGTDREVPMGGDVRKKGGGRPGRGWRR